MTTENLNCSDGAKMLIDRMADHPEEFEHYGRFSQYINMALIPNHMEMAYAGMTDEDAKAIRQAWTKVNAPKFTEGIIKAIMSPPKEEPTLLNKAKISAGGWTDPRAFYAQQNRIMNPAQNQLALQGLQLGNITVPKPEEQSKGLIGSIVGKLGF